MLITGMVPDGDDMNLAVRFRGRMKLLHRQAKPLPWEYRLARFPVVYPCTDDCGVIMPQGIVTHSGTCPNGINCLLIGEV